MDIVSTGKKNQHSILLAASFGLRGSSAVSRESGVLCDRLQGSFGVAKGSSTSTRTRTRTPKLTCYLSLSGKSATLSSGLSLLVNEFKKRVFVRSTRSSYTSLGS